MKSLKSIISMLLLACSASDLSQKGTTMELWPNGAPNTNGDDLASTIATHSTGDAAPNFQILFYPVITMDPGYTHKGSRDNFLGTFGDGKKDQKEMKKLEADYSNDLQVNRTTSRAFLALSDDDKAVPAANGFNYYQQLYKHDVPASIHIYPTGGHGWGYRESFAFHYNVIFELKAWLESF